MRKHLRELIGKYKVVKTPNMVKLVSDDITLMIKGTGKEHLILKRGSKHIANLYPTTAFQDIKIDNLSGGYAFQYDSDKLCIYFSNTDARALILEYKYYQPIVRPYKQNL